MATPASVKKITYQEWLDENEIEIVRALETACLDWVNQQANAVEHDRVDCLEISNKFVPLLIGGKKNKSKAGYQFSKPDRFLFVVTLNHFQRGISTYNTGETLKTLWNHGKPEIKNIPVKTIVKPIVKLVDVNKVAQEKEVAKKALEMDLNLFQSIRTTGTSQYLTNKQITDISNAKDCRFAEGFITLLIKDLNGNKRGIQKIYDDGRKLFTKGFVKEASFIEITGQHQTVICEGFATGMSIHLATGFKVLCALDAHNLIKVAVALKERGETAIIAADNDIRQPIDKIKENTGLVCAKKAADQTNFKMVSPQLNGEKCDFNDLHIVQGLEVVAKVFKQTKQTIVENQEELEEEFLPLSEPLNREQFLHFNKEGNPTCTLENLKVILKSYGFEVKYNVISKREETTLKSRGFTGGDADNISISRITSACIVNNMSVTHLPIYLLDIANENSYNPVVEWIESKPWDGESRLRDLEETIEQRPDFGEDLLKLLLRKWLISAVAAAYNENEDFKSKGVLVFQGTQSVGKTAWFKRLAPNKLKVFKDGVNLDVANKDSKMTVISHWIVELGELDATFKKSEIAQLKAFITEDHDLVRRPYAKKDSHFPRQTVFCGSVNDQDFLKDATGNVRFWTIPVTYLDYEHGIDMQQLWAEVAVLYQKGEQWWLTKEQENQLEESNSQFVEENRFADRVVKIFDFSSPKDTRLTTDQIFKACHILNPNKADQREMNQLLTRMFGEKRKSMHLRFYLTHALVNPDSEN